MLPSWMPWYGAVSFAAAGTVTIIASSSPRSKWPAEENWVARPPGVARGGVIVLAGSFR